MKYIVASLFILASIFAAQSASAQAQDRPASVDGMYQREEFTVYVPSGKLRPLGAVLWGGLKPADCTWWSPKDIDPRITKEPENGTVKFTVTEIVATYKADHVGAKCNGKKAPVIKVEYKSAEKFIGADEFELFILWPNAKASEMHFTVNVK